MGKSGVYDFRCGNNDVVCAGQIGQTLLQWKNIKKYKNLNL